MILSGFPRRVLRRTGSLAAVLCAAMALGGTMLPARAGDWSVESRIGARTEFDDNYELLVDSNGYVFATTAEVLGDFIYKTDRSRLDLIAYIAAQDFLGPGADTLTNNVFPRFDARYRLGGKQTDIELAASYSLEYLPAAATGNSIVPPADDDTPPPQDVGVVDSSTDTIRNTLSAGGSLTHRINVRNSLVFAASAAKTTFQGEGTNNFSTDASLAWNRRLTKSTDGSLIFGFDYLSLEDDEQTDRYFYSTRAVVSSKLSKRLSASAGAGVNLVNSYQTDLGDNRDSKVDLGYSLDAGFDYRLKTLSIGLKASYGLQPGTLGDLENQTSVFLQASKTINERSNVSLVAGAESVESFSSGGSSDSTYGLVLASTYSLALTDEWNFQAGYRFRLEDSDGGTATSNNVFLSLSRNFVAIP